MVVVVGLGVGPRLVLGPRLRMRPGRGRTPPPHLPQPLDSPLEAGDLLMELRVAREVALRGAECEERGVVLARHRLGVGEEEERLREGGGEMCLRRGV